MRNKRIIPWARDFIVGGEWAQSLAESTRRNLRWFFVDGVFASASDSIPLTYFTLYLVALGASDQQVGVYSSLTNLAGALFLFPGVMLVERFGRRHGWTVIFGGIIGRLFLLGFALLPFWFSGPELIWAVIVFAVARSITGNLAFPAWMSLTADLVPIEGRGRYFGVRGFAATVATITVVFFSGKWITLLGSPQGYQWVLLLSFVLGMVSTFSFAKIRDPRPEHRTSTALTPRSIYEDLRASPLFVALCSAAALWSFSLNIAAPFYSVYMVNELGFTAAMVGTVTIVASVSRLLTQRKAGEYADRWGSRIMQVVTMLLIPFLSLAWVFLTSYYQAIAVNIFSGILWGAFELVSFNVLLEMLPLERQARYSAIYQVIVMLSFALGAMLGAYIVGEVGFKGVFVATTIGRWLAAFLLAFFLYHFRKQYEVRKAVQ
jgi:MFS family permease